jgi:hypothetical protein
MKKLILLLSFLILLTIVAVISCDKKTDSFKSKGVIYAIDPTMCGCCGGWLMKIDDVAGFHFDGIPENSNFSISFDSLPIFVALDWQLKNNGCPSSYKWITIQKIKKE